MVSQENKPKRDRHTRILGLEEVMERLNYSRSSVYRLDKKGILRRAKQLDGGSSAGWHEDSVDAVNELRRPDPLEPPQSDDSDHQKHLRSFAPSLGGCEIEVTAQGRRTTKSLDKAKSIKRGEVSMELQDTTMVIMGNKVYFHAPTGKLLMEVGGASAFLTGMKLGVE